MNDTKTAAQPLLQVKHLRKQYKQKENIVQAVDDVDISLQAGEILGVVGESGCGKSTLARCIIRLITADEGEILRIHAGTEDHFDGTQNHCHIICTECDHIFDATFPKNVIPALQEESGYPGMKVFLFGFLADIIGSGLLYLALWLGWSSDADELYITIPALIISAALLFVFDYFFSFKKISKENRLNLALTFAIATAPYTFLIPTEWMY